MTCEPRVEEEQRTAVDEIEFSDEPMLISGDEHHDEDFYAAQEKTYREKASKLEGQYSETLVMAFEEKVAWLELENQRAIEEMKNYSKRLPLNLYASFANFHAQETKEFKKKLERRIQYISDLKEQCLEDFRESSEDNRILNGDLDAEEVLGDKRNEWIDFVENRLQSDLESEVDGWNERVLRHNEELVPRKVRVVLNYNGDVQLFEDEHHKIDSFDLKGNFVFSMQYQMFNEWHNVDIGDWKKAGSIQAEVYYYREGGEKPEEILLDKSKGDGIYSFAVPDIAGGLLDKLRDIPESSVSRISHRMKTPEKPGILGFPDR